MGGLSSFNQPEEEKKMPASSPRMAPSPRMQPVMMGGTPNPDFDLLGGQQLA